MNITTVALFTMDDPNYVNQHTIEIPYELYTPDYEDFVDYCLNKLNALYNVKNQEVNLIATIPIYDFDEYPLLRKGEDF